MSAWRRFCHGPWPIVLLIAAATLLRLRDTLHNRSLWLDEASLACNFLDRSLAQLLEPLAFNQAAPPAFLLGTKWVVDSFGIHEWTLRLIPLGAGLLIAPLFYVLASRYLGRAGTLFSLALVASSSALIFYSNEFKPYGCDALVSIAIILSLQRLVETGANTWRGLLIPALLAIISPWLSFPSVFVFAATLTAGGFRAIAAKNSQGFFVLAVIAATAAGSCALCYLSFARRNYAIPGMVDYWLAHGAFMPVPPRSAADLTWYTSQVFGFFEDVGGLHSSRNLMLALAVIGMLRFVRQRLWWITASCAGPLLLAALASGLHAYPFQGRLLLFSVPGAVLLCGAGIDAIHEATRTHRYVLGVLVAVALFSPVAYTVRTAIRGTEVEEVRPLLEQITRTTKPDVPVVVLGAETPYRYYAAKLPLPVAVFLPHDDTLASRLQRLPARAAWLLMSHLDDATERAARAAVADAGWKTIREHRRTGAFLLELSR